MVITKDNYKSRVHRPAYLDYLGIRTFDDDGPGQRRAPVPRPVLLLGVLREREPGAGAAAEGRRGAAPVRLQRAEPRRQGRDRRAGDLPARRAVPGAHRRAGRHRGEGRPPQGAPAGPHVRPPGPLRALPVLPGLPAAGPLHHRGPAADGADPAPPARRRVDRLHRPGQRVGAGPAALRGPDAARRGDRGRGRRTRPGAGADPGHPLLDRRVRRPDRRLPRRGAARHPRRRATRGLQGGLHPATGGSGPGRADRSRRRPRHVDGPVRAGPRRRRGRPAAEDLPPRRLDVAVEHPAPPHPAGSRGHRRAPLRAGPGRGRTRLRLRPRPDRARRSRDGSFAVGRRGPASSSWTLSRPPTGG